MSDTISTSDATADAGKTDDLLCVVCGYNLHGIGVDARCPECGAEVERSRDGWLLQNVSPRWLAHLRLGLWIAGGAWVLVGMYLLASWIGAADELSISVRWAIVLSTEGMMTLAIWVLTGAEPSATSAGPASRLRRWARYGPIVGVWGNLLWNSTYSLVPPITPALYLLLITGSLIFATVQAMGFLGLLALVRRYAQRALAPRLAGAYRSGAWVLAAVAAIQIACMLFQAIRVVTRDHLLDLRALLMLLTPLGTALNLFWYLGIAVLHLLLARALWGPLRQARWLNRVTGTVVT